MPHERDQWLRNVKAVEREYNAARFAVERTLDQARKDPTILRTDVETAHLVTTLSGLEGTYIVRLYAVFEEALRLFWASLRPTNPPMHDLIDGVAANRGTPDIDKQNTHAVREYRNSLVHGTEDEIEPITIPVCRSHLCKFLSRLPRQW